MLKLSNLSLFFLLLVLILLAACSNAAESPAIIVVEVSATPVNTVRPSPTPLPTPTPTPENPVVIIVPPPLPTTLPDQQVRLAEAKENSVESVDFVIDTAELEEWRSPVFSPAGSFWYKYTSQHGRFSIIMHGLHPPQEVSTPQVFENSTVKFKRIRTDYRTGASIHIIDYFDDPSLINGHVTAQEYLDAFLDSFLDRAIIISGFSGAPEVVSETNIQMNGYPGRDYHLAIDINEQAIPFRLRVYVVGNTVYQLSVSGLFIDEVLGENADRFLDSFTFNEAGGGE